MYFRKKKKLKKIRATIVGIRWRSLLGSSRGSIHTQIERCRNILDFTFVIFLLHPHPSHYSSFYVWSYLYIKVIFQIFKHTGTSKNFLKKFKIALFFFFKCIGTLVRMLGMLKNIFEIPHLFQTYLYVGNCLFFKISPFIFQDIPQTLEFFLKKFYRHLWKIF